MHLLRCHNELFGYQIQWAIIIHTADAGLTQLLPGHVNEWLDVYCLQKRKAPKTNTPFIRADQKNNGISLQISRDSCSVENIGRRLVICKSRIDINNLDVRKQHIQQYLNRMVSKDVLTFLAKYGNQPGPLDWLVHCC